MPLKIPRRHLNSFVLGGSFSALSYSHKNNLPLIINKIQKPHRFEKNKDGSTQDQWHKLYYSLSNSGLNLLDEKAQNVRIKDNEISVTTKNARVIKFDYDKIIIFDDESVTGLPTPTKENKDFIILDWISAKSCQMHDHDYWSFGDKLVSELYFYPSERLDGHHPNKKDLVAISYLNDAQLQDFEYSDTYVKFKVLSEMKKAGIGGRKCGGGKQYSLKLEVTKREIIKAAMNSYKNTETLEFR